MAANDLTTVAKVKEHLGHASTDADALLARLVTAASSAIQRYTNRDIVQASYTETRDGMGGAKMLLRQFPATLPTLVQVDGVTIPQRTAVTGAGFTFDGYRVVGLSGYTFTRGIQNVVFAYTAGWPLASMPADIEQACIELAALMFRQRSRIGDESRSVAAGGGSETVQFYMKAMQPSTREWLEQFREVCPV